MGGIWAVSRNDGQKLRKMASGAWVRTPPSLLATTSGDNVQEQTRHLDRRQAFYRRSVCDCCHELIALSCSQEEVPEIGSL